MRQGGQHTNDVRPALQPLETALPSFGWHARRRPRPADGWGLVPSGPSLLVRGMSGCASDRLRRWACIYCSLGAAGGALTVRAQALLDKTRSAQSCPEQLAHCLLRLLAEACVESKK